MAKDQSWLDGLLKGDKGDPGIQGPPGPAGTGLPTAPTDDGDYMLDVTTGVATWKALNADTLPAGFSVGLVVASGGGTFEVGHTVSLTYTATPDPLAAGISSPKFSDNQGHTNVAIVASNPVTPPSSYTLHDPASITATVAETKAGIQKSATVTGATVQDRAYIGFSSGISTTGVTTNGSNSQNVDLVGTTGTLTGGLGSFGSGHVFGQITAPGGGAYPCIVMRHTTTAVTFTDTETGFTYPMTRRVSNGAYTNREGLALGAGGVNGIDIYTANALLAASATCTLKVN